MAAFRFRVYWLTFIALLSGFVANAQVDSTTQHPVLDTVPVQVKEDTTLRILNLNPYITLHVDSTLSYDLDINRDSSQYFWFLKNAPVGLRINKDIGVLSFKADKSYFLSGRLKYDQEYKVYLGVQNLQNPKERVDTFFTLVFYNTEIIPSRIKPTILNNMMIDEGDTLSFRVQCETGSFPIDAITTLTSVPIKSYQGVNKCNDEFKWVIPYDYVREGKDSANVRPLIITFVGTDKFLNRDTAAVRVYVRDAINYPYRLQEYNKMVKDVERYILQLKFTFKELDKKVRSTKNTRTGFDLTSGTMAMGGTILSTMPDESQKNAGKILPSVGVTLVPVKEAVAPVKTYEQNSAAQVRTSIKRLEYLLSDNILNSEKDPDILAKIKKLRDELKQTQTQLIDVPMLDTGVLSEDELNDYFNNPKVNKKYKLSKK
ncbi:hypothetical protein KJS94_04850 [Flavihumibacter rivuli]|uniref:hypothetical protein n=1 Tax=Flavihumibacter rivuli TaxID=2838156 RepID=UPI001BDEFF0C|nr:hypothetical protein [Flavihumibacter rivuli]ULQ57527.1 hypothetical protein KJS94_04850 [Flavihumibacter rivuli]